MGNRFETRATKILGCDYPLVMGTMGWQSCAEFVAAAANAGVFASLASTLCGTGQALRDEIRKTRSLTDKPFGVNINLFPMMRSISNEELIDTALEEGITVIETSGRSPEPFVNRIKQADARLVHKCARLRDARTAERCGADLVEIVGFECGGHPSREGIGSLVLVPQVVDALRVPVIAGGGIADGRGLLAVMALGAEGALLGTRFLATQECPIHPKVKERIVASPSTETMLAMRTLSDPIRVLRTELMTRVDEMETNGATKEDILPLVAGERSMKALSVGDIEGALLACGQVVGLVDDVPTMKELVQRIIREATAAAGRLGGVFAVRPG